MPLVQTRGAASAQGFGEFAQAAVAANYIEEVFSTYLYTGNDSTQTITNNIDLSTKGGMVFVKGRDIATGGAMIDTVRGVNKNIVTDQNYAQDSDPSVSAFNITGFSINSAYSFINDTGNKYVSWTFRKQPKFFDVLTYTGTSSVQTIAHSLGSVPGCIIVKRTNTTSNWRVYHRSLTSAAYMVELNTSAGQAVENGAWNSTAPTSSVFTVGSASEVNASGSTYVAYVFAHDSAGFGLLGTDNVISCGSFTTNGSGVASVNLGYEPQWIVAKAVAGGTGSWVMQDNMRGFTASPTVYTANPLLFANSADSEATFGASTLQANSTGFTTASATYDPSVTYIYIAIRRGPMKVPTVGTSVYDAKLYTGAGTNPVTISGISMVPDLASNFIRDGNGQGAIWWDRLRGGTVNLEPRSTGAENTQTAATATFDKMTTVTVSGGDVNVSSSPFVNHFFKRAPSVFDIVCYTGTGSNTTFTHNLTVVPELIIVKRRDATGAWDSYSSALANTEYVVLNTTAAKATGATRWNSTTPTSSVFSVGTSTTTNASAGTYVAYLFATCASVSKIGSYTGNGTTQTINCGFGAGGARFVLLKRTDSTGDWYVYDTARGMTVLTDPYFWFNSLAAEAATLGSVTTVSTGFALNESVLAGINTNAASYIFLSFA